MNSEGIVFGIQRFSIHDGPGIRTTVFLKGCNMRCRWCHNPESYRAAPVLAFNPALCKNCGACAAVCPNGVHTLENGEHQLKREACTVCGTCVKACRSKALEVIGTRSTSEQVMKQVLKDRRYYTSSGGGVTLSGGEALLQMEFSMELLEKCHAEGIHTVVETNGSLPFERYRAIMPLVDLFLVDYKLTDEKKHREYTGCDREVVVRNIEDLHGAGAKMLLRCPIIPGVNDEDDHFSAIAGLTLRCPDLLGAELLAYHNLGASKAERIGVDYEQFDTPEKEALERWKNKVRGFGGRVWEGK